MRERIGAFTAEGGGTVELDASGPFPVILEAAAYIKPVYSLAVIHVDPLGDGPTGSFSRFTLDAVSLSGGLLKGALVADPVTGAPDSFALYDFTRDAGGVIGARALHPSDDTLGTIRNLAIGGTTPVEANVRIGNPQVAEGLQNTVNSLTFSNGGALVLTPRQALSITASSILAQSGASSEISGGELRFP